MTAYYIRMLVAIAVRYGFIPVAILFATLLRMCGCGYPCDGNDVFWFVALPALATFGFSEEYGARFLSTTDYSWSSIATYSWRFAVICTVGPLLAAYGIYWSFQLPACILTMCALFLLLGGWKYAEQQLMECYNPHQSQYRRGRQLLTFGQARKRAAAMVRRTNAVRDAASATLTFGGLQLPTGFAENQILVVGAPGSGKTVTLQLLMQSVLPLVGRVPGHRAIVYDPKRDIISTLYGMELAVTPTILNPLDARCSPWDIAADVRTPAMSLAVAKILAPPEHESQPFFNNAGRDLIFCVLVGLQRSAACQGPDRWTFRDVLAVLTNPGRLRTLLDKFPDTRETLDIYTRNDATFHSIVAQIRTKVAPFETVAGLWGRAKGTPFSLERWVTSHEIVVLGLDDSSRPALDAVNQLIFKRASELILAGDEPNQRNWIFLDELGQAGRLEGLSDLLLKGRTKGARIAVGFQDIETLRKPTLYGREGTNELVGLCGNKVILRLDSRPSAEWAAQEIGDVELLDIQRSRRSTSGSQPSSAETVSEQIVKRQAVLAEEILTLPFPNNGMLDGYFITPSVGVYRTRHSFAALLSRRSTRSGEGDFEPRPPDEQQPLPWTADDNRRLAFPDDVQGGIEKPSQEFAQPHEPTGLNEIRRISRDALV